MKQTSIFDEPEEEPDDDDNEGEDQPRPPASNNAGDTSHWAADSMRESAATMRAKVLAYIERRGNATCDEAMRDLGYTHQACSPRFWELAGKNRKQRERLPPRIRPAGFKRRTRSGRSAEVWEVIPKAERSL